MNESDADFQRSSAKVNKTVFSGEERKWMVDKQTALKYLKEFDQKKPKINLATVGVTFAN